MMSFKFYFVRNITAKVFRRGTVSDINVLPQCMLGGFPIRLMSTLSFTFWLWKVDPQPFVKQTMSVYCQQLHNKFLSSHSIIPHTFMCSQRGESLSLPLSLSLSCVCVCVCVAAAQTRFHRRSSSDGSTELQAEFGFYWGRMIYVETLRLPVSLVSWRRKSPAVCGQSSWAEWEPVEWTLKRPPSAL